MTMTMAGRDRRARRSVKQRTQQSRPTTALLMRLPWRTVIFIGFFLLPLYATGIAEAVDRIPSQGSEPIRIGVVGALTGPKMPYGRSQLHGAELAALEINSGGGIAGRKIEIVSADDHGEPGDVGSIADGLIHRDRVAAIVGSVDSGCTHVLAMLAVKCHVPHITCVATDPSLTRAGTPWTFRTLADDERQAEALVEWLHTNNVSRLALIAAETRYGKMGAKTMTRRARAVGMRVDGPYMIAISSDKNDARKNPDAGDPEDIVARALNGASSGEFAPDAVVIWGLAREGVRVAAALSKLKFHGIICGGDGLATPAFYGSAASETEGIIVTCPYVESDPGPANRIFREAYRQAYGELPDSFAAHAWDTLHLIAKAHSTAGPEASPDAFREAISLVGSNFEGATGRIAFDATGNDTRRVRLARCRAGTLEPFK
ncbi:MAG: ABC transporter substrate-binding protein [Candidatus Riflebacteria bacterium]|nr:ABC transporter substrate-binding protein [Candidatus Riflebacteria bacterium]